MADPVISIVAPTMNEEMAPRIVRELFREFGNGVEVIVVDKSSPAYRKQFAGSGARVVVQKRKGYEDAIMQGFRMARGTAVLASIDPDGTYSVRDLRRVVDEVKSGRYDFVSGSRSGCSNEAMKPYIKLGNRLFALLFDLLFLKSMGDVFSGSFAMSRKSFELIRHIDPYQAGTIFFEMELAKRGCSMRNLHVSYAPRVGTKSKLARYKVVYGTKVFAGVLRSRFGESLSLLSGLFRGRLKGD